MASISADEKRWRAESDARALAEANVITGDSARLKAAQAAAKRMAEEQVKQAKSMQKVAKTETKKSTAKPRTSKAAPKTTTRKKK
ncbi:MAG TPA: hypothetical protein DD734_07805 [Firmicutes bacterium]|nr:hypothetical protein [Bacillota bacterium]